jgi:hypothetical protein
MPGRRPRAPTAALRHWGGVAGPGSLRDPQGKDRKPAVTPHRAWRDSRSRGPSSRPNPRSEHSPSRRPGRGRPGQRRPFAALPCRPASPLSRALGSKLRTPPRQSPNRAGDRSPTSGEGCYPRPDRVGPLWSVFRAAAEARATTLLHEVLGRRDSRGWARRRPGIARPHRGAHLRPGGRTKRSGCSGGRREGHDRSASARSGSLGAARGRRRRGRRPVCTGSASSSPSRFPKPCGCPGVPRPAASARVRRGTEPLPRAAGDESPRTGPPC